MGRPLFQRPSRPTRATDKGIHQAMRRTLSRGRDDNVCGWFLGVRVEGEVNLSSTNQSGTCTHSRPLPRANTDSSSINVQAIGVHRDCFGCGRTCEECRARYMRTCRFCRAEYCVIDNEGSSDTEVCGFPCYRSGTICMVLPYRNEWTLTFVRFA